MDEKKLQVLRDAGFEEMAVYAALADRATGWQWVHLGTDENGQFGNIKALLENDGMTDVLDENDDNIANWDMAAAARHLIPQSAEALAESLGRIETLSAALTAATNLYGDAERARFQSEERLREVADERDFALGRADEAESELQRAVDLLSQIDEGNNFCPFCDCGPHPDHIDGCTIGEFLKGHVEEED